MGQTANQLRSKSKVTEAEQAHETQLKELNDRLTDAIENLVILIDDQEALKRDALRKGLQIDNLMAETEFAHCLDGDYFWDWDERYFAIRVQKARIVSIAELEESLLISSGDLKEVSKNG